MPATLRVADQVLAVHSLFKGFFFIVTETKTRPSGAGVKDYVASKANDEQRADCQALIAPARESIRGPGRDIGFLVRQWFSGGVAHVVRWFS